MKNYTLNEEQVKSIAKRLREAGYQDYETTGYTRYKKKYGDSVFIHHRLNIIRATKDTKGNDIFGDPNGKCCKGEEDRLNAWYFNGYTGKRGTTVG